MSTSSLSSIQLLLRAKKDIYLESQPHVRGRQNIHKMAILWLKTAYRRAQSRGIYGQPKEGSKTHASDGDSSFVSKAKNLYIPSRTSDFPLFAKRCPHYICQSGMEQRYHLCTYEKRFLLSCRCHGLVFPICAGMATLQFPRRNLLYRSSQGCVSPWKARDLQQRPRMSIHKRGFYFAAAKQRNSYQYGWKRTVHRQHLDRASLAKYQIRRLVYSRICRWIRPIQRIVRVFSFLQFPTTSPSVILQNTRRDISANMIRSMHTNVLWIASKNLSTVLGKLSKFSTVNTDPDDEKIKINLDQNFHLNFAHFCSSQWGPLHMVSSLE